MNDKAQNKGCFTNATLAEMISMTFDSPSVPEKIPVQSRTICSRLILKVQVHFVLKWNRGQEEKAALGSLASPLVPYILSAVMSYSHMIVNR